MQFLEREVISMVEFNIVEGSRLEDELDWDNLKKDYQDLTLTVAEIQTKYGLTNSKWQTVRKHLESEGIPLRNRGRVKNSYGDHNAKHYHKDKRSGKYLVRKVLDGKYTVFGLFDTENEAKAKVEELKRNGWKK